MSCPYVINVSSDEEDEDDVQVLAFHQATQKLIDQAPPKVVKKLCEAECPICFDSITNATTTVCGHVYCLECLQMSISSSSARGQTRGKKGVGLCPMCRKSVAFKDTIVLRLKKGGKVAPPNPPKMESSEAGSNVGNSEDDHEGLSGSSPRASNTSHTEDELIDLF